MKNLLCIIFIILFTTTLFAQNNCLDFDGTDDYVSVPDITYNNITVEAWIYRESDSGTFEHIFSDWYDNEESNRAVNFSIDPGDIVGWGISKDGGSQPGITSSTTISVGKWYHVAGTYDGATMKVYINGVLEASNTISSGNIHNNVYVKKIGTRATNGQYFNGKIDEFRIWDDARTEAEIRSNMYKELVGNESNLLVYYKMNETSGPTVEDSQSSESNDGTWNGSGGGDYTSATWRTSGSMFGPRMCLDFDGGDDYVSLGTPASFETNHLTVETWIKSDVTDGWQHIVSKRSDGESATTYFQWSLQTDDNSDTYQFGVNVGGTDYWTDSGVSVTTDWTHLAGTYDGQTVKIYVNGILMDDNTDPSGNIYSIATMPVYIAARLDNDLSGPYPDHHFNGKIDEVRIWDDVRTEEEIQNNMCRTLDGDEDNLVAYYRFDQLSTDGQTTLYDITSNENNGTLNNMDATSDWVECTAFDTWIGWYDTAWSEAKNWSRGVPDNSENVGLFKWTLGHAPTVGSSSSAKTLVIGLLETLTLNNGLTIDGNLFELGNLVHNNQAVTCAGSGAQYLVGSLDFYNLTINNSSSDKKVNAWWTTSLQVDNTLTVTDGVFYSKSDYTNVSIASEGTLELSGDITVSGNWDNDGTFTHNNHKVTFDGLSAQTIQGDHSTTFHDCTVANTSGVVLGNSNTVNNTLDLNNDSKITLGSNTLTIGSSGSVTNYDSDSYIVTNSTGVLKRNSVGSGSTAFPIGNAAYNPVFINNSGTIDNFSVKVVDGTPGNISDATRVVNRTWTISEDAAGGSNVALMLQWNGGETGSSFDIEDQLVIGRYLGSGTSWETKSATHAGSGPYAAEASGFTSFSDFVVASGGSGTLPVVLSIFTAQYFNNTPTIHWSTQSETDNMGWFIYRNEENEFSTSEVISDLIEGHGTTTQQQSYVYEDRIQELEVNSTYYYWLESIDYSGIINHYDKVAILTIPDNGNGGNPGVVVPERFGLFQNEPNPVITTTRIAFNLPETAKVDLAIYNLKGQLVKHLFSGNSSKHTVMWDGKDEHGNELENGVYLLKLIVQGTTHYSRKLILLR